LKARVVAKDNEYIEGLNFQETFAPVVQWTTIRTIIALTTQKNWPLGHLSVITAYLNGLLLEDVYMIISSCFPKARQICKLNRALYGLKQASRAWYIRIDAYFQKTGLTRSNEDPNLYFSTRKGKHTLLLLYVDDIISTGDDEQNIKELKKDLMHAFKMTDLGPAHYYLGVKQRPKGIYFHQRGSILKFLDHFGMTKCTSLNIPMNPITKLQKDTKIAPIDSKLY
jgi:hypothetical protein